MVTRHREVASIPHSEVSRESWSVSAQKVNYKSRSKLVEIELLSFSIGGGSTTMSLFSLPDIGQQIPS